MLHVGSAMVHPNFLRRLELTLRAFLAKLSMTDNTPLSHWDCSLVLPLMVGDLCGLLLGESWQALMLHRQMQKNATELSSVSHVFPLWVKTLVHTKRERMKESPGQLGQQNGEFGEDFLQRSHCYSSLI